MPPKTAHAHPAQLAIELEGPGLTARTVDPRALLGLASDYIDAFQTIAVSRHVKIDLQGVEMLERRPAVRIGVDDEDQAQEVAIALGREIDPDAKRAHLRTLSKRIAALPPSQRASVHLAGLGWSAPLVPSHTISQPRVVRERTNRRLIVERAGGERPTVRFLDERTGKAFTLSAKRDKAAIAGQGLYRRADVEMVAEMHPQSLRIVGGELVDIKLLDERPLTFEDMERWWTGRYAGRA